MELRRIIQTAKRPEGIAPDGKKVRKVIKIKATQDAIKIRLHLEFDKTIWRGLSWVTAEIRQGTFDIGNPPVSQRFTVDSDAAKLTSAL